MGLMNRVERLVKNEVWWSVSGGQTSKKFKFSQLSICAFLNGGCRFTQFSRIAFAPTSANELIAV